LDKVTRAIISYNAKLGGWIITVPEVVGEDSSVVTGLGTIWETASEALDFALVQYGTATLGAGDELDRPINGTIE
jgi:predicted ABC-type sugar transport system permease subunit